jgi:hypothetical protein
MVVVDGFGGHFGVECQVCGFSRRRHREEGRKWLRERIAFGTRKKTAVSVLEDSEMSLESVEGGVGDDGRKRGSWNAGGCLA